MLQNIAYLLCSGNLQEKHIRDFGALCDTEGSRVDIERLWAGLGVCWVIADECDRSHMTGL